ncbi:MAG: PDC sensor domain-containing protein [Candidatus Nitrosocosmicus sp.]
MLHVFIGPYKSQNISGSYQAGQVGLTSGYYPDHPWCQEFNRASTASNIPFATEPYFGKSQHQKVISIYYPLRDANGTPVGQIDAALNLADLGKDFFHEHSLDKRD